MFGCNLDTKVNQIQLPDSNDKQTELTQAPQPSTEQPEQPTPPQSEVPQPPTPSQTEQPSQTDTPPDTTIEPPQQQQEPPKMPGAFTLSEPSATGFHQFQFQWQTSEHADNYSVCLKDDSQLNRCSPLITALSSTQIRHTFDQILSPSSVFFVLANNQTGSTKSNEVSISSTTLLNAISLLKHSNADSQDEFGHVLALNQDGTRLAVGAINESGLANDPNVNTFSNSGATYIFELDSNNWQQKAYLKPSNSESGDEFGYALDLSDDGKTLAVSALQEGSNATGVDGDQNDNSKPLSGAVYVFTLTGETWQQQAYLKASNTDAYDSFGFSVSLSGDGKRLLVGAPGESSSASGINANQLDNTGALSGAAYLFEFQNDTWVQTQYFKPSNTGNLDSFGFDVDISQDGLTASIASPGEDSLNGDPLDNNASNSGAVYLFNDDGAQWSQHAYLKASLPDAEDQFGYSISLNHDGSTLAISAYLESSDSVTNGNDADNSAPNAGAAYIFQQQQDVWSQQAYLKADNSDSGDKFGHDLQLDLSGERLIVGAPFESSSDTGVGGLLKNNDTLSSGAVYEYQFKEGNWQQTKYIKATNPDQDDLFGDAVAISGQGNTLAVGAKQESSAPPLSDNAPTDNSLSKSGAVYLY
ncbi:hypothetical protein VAZ01S_094_00120 [Vibrio azureus NBRC 104587]|uniref:Integrin alpha beta-propellor repeat protein n=2 Tax=Vibrio azureus TaxID=512649 RepID=U3AVR1_9VIBR|nr:FG-GAP repeat protein [Vibrio azureus]GAD77820.1 hypothetical protein VAZ01S_094_00120 [Vibrio azureus NBRC 104587]